MVIWSGIPILELEWIGRGRGTDENHGKDCIEEGFHLAWVKLDRIDERGSEALGVRPLLLFEMKNWN